jgi:hypothetical protein
MSNKQLLNHIDNVLDSYINTISDKYNINKDELKQLWYSDSYKPPQKTVSNVNTLQTIDMDDLSPQRLLKCSKVELAALCKHHGKKFTSKNKKEDLLALLQEKSVVNIEPKKPIENNIKKSIQQIPSVIKNITSTIQTIPIRKNCHGNLEHSETKLIFDKNTKKVFGKQEDDGTVSDLCDDDIQNCKKFKFAYDVPQNLDKKNTLEKVKLQELEDDDIEVVDEDDTVKKKNTEEEIEEDEEEIEEEEQEEEEEEEEEIEEEEF